MAALFNAETSNTVDNHYLETASLTSTLLGQDEAFNLAAQAAVTENQIAEDAVWERYIS